MAEHVLDARYLESEVRVALAGCGGNGSQMLTGLARLNHAMRALGHPGLRVEAFDPDRVSEANVGRQLFAPVDVGLPKASVLVHRLNAYFGLDWVAHVDRMEHWNPFGIEGGFDLVVSCVDSRAARVAIDRKRPAVRDGARPYWLDLGNREADGQVVLGQWPIGDEPDTPRLPTVLELFPEMRDLRTPEDDAPSCGLAEALERQELFINQAVVTQALAILWTLFRFGRISWHGAFVNLRTGRTQPLAVDPEAWARLSSGVPVPIRKQRRRAA